MKKALGFGLAIVMPFVIGSAFVTPHPASHDALPVDPPAIEAPVHMPPPSAAENEGDLDLIGNPVTDAVARYKYDQTGSLYEVHSPQTELPRLAPPTS